MPAALPAVASWAAAAWSSAVTATAVGLTKLGVMAAIGEGATIALAGTILKTGAVVALSAGAAALMRPNTPSSGTTLDFKPDPKAAIRGGMGYTAIGGNKVFQASWGYKRVALTLGCALSLGPIAGVTQFTADKAVVNFTGPQNEATGFYAADMWQKTTRGLPGDTALLPPTGLKYGNPPLTGWGAQHAAPGVAFGLWTMVLAKNPEDRDVFTNGVPVPRWAGRWMMVWDPRKDSTYPGGNGPQRRDDWRTWEWSECAYCHALAWARGHYKLNLDGSLDRTKRIAGIGAPDALIDIPAFVEGMNIAEANEWVISGEWSTDDGKFQTFLAMLQAGGGTPISRGGQISVEVKAPRVATYTYTRADLIGEADIRPMKRRRERKNTIIPRYRSEVHNWEYVPAGGVTAQTYRDEDGGEPRSVEIEYVHVRKAKQAAQLAAYDLAELRESLTALLPSKAHLMHMHAGDCMKVDVPELALAGQKFVIRRATSAPKSMVATLECRSETDGKHPWALGQTEQAPSSPQLSAVDPKYVPPPAPGDWTVVPKPPGEGGISQPIVIIELPINTTDIIAVIIRHGPSAAGPWTDGYEGSPRTDGRYEVSGLTPGQTYCFSLQYVAKNGAKSDPDIQCGIVAGDLIAGGVTDEAAKKLIDEATKEVDDKVGDALGKFEKAADLDGLFKAQEDLAEAILKLGRGQTELQRILETNTRDGGKLVKSIVRVIGGELENAQGAIVEEATLSLQRDQAEAIIRQALALQVDQNRASAETSISALVTTQTAEIAARKALGVRVGNTEVALSDEAMVRASETGGLATTLALMGVRNGSSSGFILNQNTVQWGPEGTLAQVLSGLRATDGSNSSQIVSLLEATANQASHLTTLSSAVNGNTSSVSVLMAAVEGLGARWTLNLTSNGIATSIIADGETRAIRFLAENLSVSSMSGDVLVTPFMIAGSKIRMSGQIEVDGGAMIDGTLTTRKIVADNITIIDSAMMAGSLVGNGSFQTAISYSITLAHPAKLLAWASGAQAYSAGNQPYAFHIEINGNTYPGVSGSGGPIDSVGAQAFANVSAGTHVVRLRWMGTNNQLRLATASMMIMAVFK